MQFGKLGDNTGTVGSVGDAKPLGVGVEHLHCSLARIDQSVDAEGDEPVIYTVAAGDCLWMIARKMSRNLRNSRSLNSK